MRCGKKAKKPIITNTNKIILTINSFNNDPNVLKLIFKL